MLTHKTKIIIFYIVAVLFIAANSFLIATRGIYILNLLPLALILLAALFFALDKLMLFSVFCIPLSVPLTHYMPGLGFNVDIPTEPFFVGIMFIFILKLILERNYDKKILRHPISVMIFIFLLWKLVTVATSTMPLVSLKFWIASLWFILPFYFLIILLFKEERNMFKFFFLYSIPFAAIIVLTLVKHSSYAFDQHIANGIMQPFFNDHTSYGAAIAMFLPFLFGFVFSKFDRKWRIVSAVLLVIFVVGLVFSYTRAAWLSLLGSVAMYFILKFKINYKVVLVVALLGVAGIAVFQNKILFKLEGNKVESSTDFSKHIKSISNVTSDASNLERINRWNCAIRMFKEKPFFGWGPGTYQFKYAPFQHSNERTIISTNAGDGGNAHSEYLGSLAESGFLGMLNYVMICIFIFVYGTKKYHELTDTRLRFIIGSAL
ncbi:MAG: O-antigen ligase family protein, partial [Bacteroidales bacterium]|nr:O-antigen ligase family protein [Bacteroidales bacterium]